MRDTSWGSESGPGKDPKTKHLPRTWGKRKTSFSVRPYQKMMSKKEYQKYLYGE